MEEINIQARGLELNEMMRKHILQRLHSVFGFEQYEVSKIIISLFDEKGKEGETENSCHIHIKVRGLPTIKTEIKSLDILTAVTLAIERAHLKLSHSLRNKRNDNQRVLQNENSKSYDLYGIYQ